MVKAEISSKLPDWKVSNKKEMWQDEWGNIWMRADASSKGEVKIPALKKWDDLKSYKPPDIDNPARYKEAREKFKAYPDKYKIGTLPGFTFNIMRKLRGLHNFFLDVRLHSDKILELSKTIETLLLRCIDNWAEAGAQGVIFPEDWGMSDRLLINPKKWRELFKPSFATLISKAHDRGLHVFMHSDGYIYEIIEDLIDCGLDVLQLDDVCLLGIERLGEEFGGRIAFWNTVDTLHTLPSGKRELIEREAQKQIECLGSRNGGFIAKDYFDDLKAVGVKEEWDEWAYQAFLKHCRLWC